MYGVRSLEILGIFQYNDDKYIMSEISIKSVNDQLNAIDEKLSAGRQGTEQASGAGQAHRSLTIKKFDKKIS